MKKLIGAVFIIAMISMVGAIVSFFIFDFSNFMLAKSRGFYHIEKELEKNVESIFESFDTTISEDIQNYPDSFENKIEEFSMSIVENIIEKGLSFIEVGSEAFDSLLLDAGIEDGYITEDSIENILQKIQHEWQVNHSENQLQRIHLDISNANLVVGKTKERNVKFYLTTHQKNDVHGRIPIYHEEMINTKHYNLSFNPGNNKPYHIAGFTIYMLIPDNYSGSINIDMKNGNLVSIAQKNDMDMDVKNGNIIIGQYKEQNLDVELKNGNYIMNYENQLENVAVNAKVKNGIILGLAPQEDDMHITVQNLKYTFGEGDYRLNIDVHNGNIISK
ncbi:MAG: hypothetical protein Q4A29_03540 [Eubacteriales bacterium]|nr:hypothetical protein [Eubacteriales bacterium]